MIAAATGLSGLGELVADHPVVRAWFEIIGAALLITFGALPLIKAWRARSLAEGRARAARPRRLVAWALVTVVTNAKAWAIYVVVVPPALSAGTPALEGYTWVAAVHIVILFAWLGFLGALITRVPAIATRPRIVVGLQLAASAMLIVMGVQSGASGIWALV